jgi:hypothetical protein
MDRRPELWGGECNVLPVLANLDEEEWGFVLTYYWIMFRRKTSRKDFLENIYRKVGYRR